MATVSTAKSSGYFQGWVYFLTLFLTLNVGGMKAQPNSPFSGERGHGMAFLFALSIQAEQRL